MHAVSGNSISSNPAQLAALPAPIHRGFVEAFGHSLTFVFLVAVPFAVVAFVLCWFIPEDSLRDKAFVSERTHGGRSRWPTDRHRHALAPPRVTRDPPRH